MNRIFVIFTLAFFCWNCSLAQHDVQFEITVAPDGSADFTSIQAAIDATKAFPGKRIIIYIKNGIYHEKVRIPSWNNLLSLIGEDPGKTIISWDDHFEKIDRGRNSTFYTWTLLVEADDFYAENLTIENTAGPVGQAVALHVEGNRCAFKNCRILGHQDTLYLAGEQSKQYFVHCEVAGTTDFIFGAATAVFKDCRIVCRSNSYITAASTFKGQEFGFVFMNCRLEADKDVDAVYLGRPWRPYAKTVFLNCEMGAHIRAEGWQAWSNEEQNETTYYAEFQSSGQGSNTQLRAEWAHQLTSVEAEKYTIENILGNWYSHDLEGRKK